MVPLGRWKMFRCEIGMNFKLFPSDIEGVHNSSKSSGSMHEFRGYPRTFILGGV